MTTNLNRFNEEMFLDDNTLPKFDEFKAYNFKPNEKLCELCLLPFTYKRKSQKFCKRAHKNHCSVCGAEYVIKKLNQPSKTCSSSCASSLSHTPAAKEKRKENSLKKWGTEHPFQSKEIKEKIQIGLDNSDKDMRFGSANFKKTIKEKYGVDNCSQLEEVKEKKRDTLKKHYGVDNPMKISNISELIKKKTKERHGVERRADLTVKHLEDWLNLREYIGDQLYTIEELTEYFDVSREKMAWQAIRHQSLYNIKGYGAHNSSKERYFEEYLKKTHPNVAYKKNDRTILNGKELDFFFPNERIAVEISPTSTHNSLKGAFNQDPKPQTYHKEKFLKCAEQGVELITIFDWHPWDNILELISSKLESHNKRIPARKTIYKEHDKISKELFDLLSSWHTLSLPSKFKRDNKVGTLTLNEEIVGIALWTDTKDPNIKELKRMVFKPGVSVVGGPSKLLKNYIRTHKEINKIITFSDCDLGWGRSYQTIGFTLIEESKPTLTYWSDKHKMKVKNTSLVMQGADRLLRNLDGYKPVGMGDNLPSNSDIVIAYGFLPIYDCGYRKWELELKN